VVSTANAKLALFYDWLFYQPDKDNIMNIGESFYNYYITIFATLHWHQHWLPVESYFLGTTESNLYYSIF